MPAIVDRPRTQWFPICLAAGVIPRMPVPATPIQTSLSWPQMLYPSQRRHALIRTCFCATPVCPPSPIDWSDAILAWNRLQVATAPVIRTCVPVRLVRPVCRDYSWWLMTRSAWSFGACHLKGSVESDSVSQIGATSRAKAIVMSS